jgi:hypothetical protein
LIPAALAAEVLVAPAAAWSMAISFRVCLFTLFMILTSGLVLGFDQGLGTHIAPDLSVVIV